MQNNLNKILYRIVTGSRSRLSSYNSNQNVSVGPENQRTDVSDHVAVYLAELTSEMVTEMKSELREMVHAVDEIISPSTVCERSSTSSTDTVVKETTASVTTTENCNKCEDSISLNESSSGEIEGEISILDAQIGIFLI